MSNQDLKHFSKSDLLGFAGAVFHGLLPPEGDLTTELTTTIYTPDPTNDILEKVYTSDQKVIFSRKFTLLTKNDMFEKVYTSDPKNDIFEKVYTSDPKMRFSKKFTLLTQKVIFSKKCTLLTQKVIFSKKFTLLTIFRYFVMFTPKFIFS